MAVRHTAIYNNKLHSSEKESEIQRLPDLPRNRDVLASYARSGTESLYVNVQPYFSVVPGKCLQFTATASFHVLSNSLFIVNRNIP